MALFDVIMGSFFRSEVLARCFASFPDVMPKEFGKIIITIHQEDLKTKKLLENKNNLYPIEIIELEKQATPGATRNHSLSKASSKYLCFIDDDTQLPEDYFYKAIAIIQKNQFTIFGGPDQSFENKSDIQFILGELLGHKFFMGPTHKRHKSVGDKPQSTDESNLTLCNMWMNNEIFTTHKLRFNENLKRCEENELLDECQSLGFEMWYIPYLVLYHLRRESLKATIKIQWSSGYNRAVSLRRTGTVGKLYFIIPWAVGFTLSVGWLLSFSLMVFLFCLHLTLMMVIFFQTKIKTLGLRGFFKAWTFGLAIHVCFSLGIFWGTIFRRGIGKSINS